MSDLRKAVVIWVCDTNINNVFFLPWGEAAAKAVTIVRDELEETPEREADEIVMELKTGASVVVLSGPLHRVEVWKVPE